MLANDTYAFPSEASLLMLANVNNGGPSEASLLLMLTIDACNRDAESIDYSYAG